AFERFDKVYGNIAAMGPKGGSNWESMPRSQNMEDFRGLVTESDNVHGLISGIDTLPAEGRFETAEELTRIGEDANAYTHKAVTETLTTTGQPDHLVVESLEEWWDKSKPAASDQAEREKRLEDVLLGRKSK